MQKKQTGGETKEGKKKENSEKGDNKKKTKKNKIKTQFECEEYLIKDHYDSVTSSLNLFKDDALCSEPGIGWLPLFSADGRGFLLGSLDQMCFTGFFWK